MKTYYIESIGYNVLGDILTLTLSKNETDKIAFKQAFERAWEPIEYKSSHDALNGARAFLERQDVYLSEDRESILGVYGDEVALFYKITFEQD